MYIFESFYIQFNYGLQYNNQWVEMENGNLESSLMNSIEDIYPIFYSSPMIPLIIRTDTLLIPLSIPSVVKYAVIGIYDFSH